MASLTVGTNGTLKALALEGQIHELGTLLIAGQRNETFNPPANPYFSASTENDGYLWTLNYNFPVLRSFEPNGGILLSAEEFLSGNFNFSPGVGGTINNPSSLGYLLNLIFLGQDKEKNTDTNPTGLNYISGNFNIDSDLITGSLTLEREVTFQQDGGIKWNAKEYLL